MKRIGWLAFAVLAVLVGVWFAKRDAVYRAVAEHEQRVLQGVADSLRAEALKSVEEARTLREGIKAASDARKAAERASRATRTALHGLLDSAEVAARDSSVKRDSLARLVLALGAKIRADDSTRAVADSLADVERLRTGLTIATQASAIDRLQSALDAEIRSHAKTRQITRRSFLSRVASTACTLALVGGGAELGSQVGSAAAGGAGGLLASGIVCK